MCDAPLYIDQVKNMAGLDYAAISDTLTREFMVILLEMPEAFDLINSFKSAAECEAKKSSSGNEERGKTSKEEEEWEEFGGEEDPD
jgi:hypothetical protein